MYLVSRTEREVSATGREALSGGHLTRCPPFSFGLWITFVKRVREGIGRQVIDFSGDRVPGKMSEREVEVGILEIEGEGIE